MCQKRRNAGERLRASSSLMGESLGLGRQSRSLELRPRGGSLQKGFGQGPGRDLASWRCADALGYLQMRGFLSQRLGLLSGSLQSFALRSGSLLSRTQGLSASQESCGGQHSTHGCSVRTPAWHVWRGAGC